MNRIIQAAVAALALFSFAVNAQAATQVAIETSKGRIVVELDAEKAPLTVANFLAYVDKDYYAGTVFHRVIETFMIQGGGFNAEMEKKPTDPPVVNEAKNGLTNDRGTIAMARTGNPHSATAQFFINTVDNVGLDNPEPDGWGYAVFGRVVEGLDVVDAIAGVRTGRHGRMSNVPKQPVLINGISRVE